MLEAFANALRGGPLPDGLTARDPAEVSRRFDVYRNTVASSLSQALASRFPVIRLLVGAEFFAALAQAYQKLDGPRTPILAEWGAGFAAFLEAFAPLAAYPYLGDVARIEFARGLAFHAADAAPLDPARLTALDPARLRLVLHPSVRVLQLAHPGVAIWARHQPGGADLPIPPGPQTALILRDRAFQVPVRALDRADARLIEGLLQGRPLAQLTHDQDPQHLLVTLMAAGALIDAVE